MNNKLGFGQKLAYGLGDFGFNISFQTVAIFLMVFYTDVLHIPPTTAGTIFLVASLWDGFTDPIMGYLANRTRSRWGKYRPYLLWVALPLGVSYVLLFYRPALPVERLVGYALLVHLLYRTVFTIGNIPYSALATEMTLDQSERGSLAGFRLFLGMAGALLVGSSTPKLLAFFAEAPNPYFRLALSGAALAALIFFISFSFTRERVGHALPSRPFRLGPVLGMLRQNWPFWLLFAFMLLGMGTVAMLYQSLNYYYTYCLEQPEALGQAMLVLQGAMMVSIPLWVWLGRRSSKRNALLGGALSAITGSLFFYLHPAPVFWQIALSLLLLGAGIGSGAVSFWSMLPDTVEYGQWKTGIRAEGVIAGLGLLSLKVSLGLGSWALGMLLQYIGYVPNAIQSAATRQALHLITSLSPAITFSCIALIIWWYPIDAAFHRKLLHALKKEEKS